jgi:hypothetical protein
MTHNPDSARLYVDQKRILQLAQTIAGAIAYSKPDDPIPFIKQLLLDLKAARDENKPLLVCFTEDNIKAMFTILDPFNKGTVTRPQMEGALSNFGTDPVLFSSILGEAAGPFKLEEFSNLIHEGIKQTLFPPK